MYLKRLLKIIHFPPPDCALSLDSSGLVKKRDEVPGSAPVFEAEMTLEVVCEMVGVPARERGADWADHLLIASITMMTSHMILK